MKKDSKQKLWFALGVSLTLGLAPFVPEPHLWGKLKWVYGGAEGMQPMDWLDLALHGAPWVYLVYLLVKNVWQRINA